MNPASHEWPRLPPERNQHLKHLRHEWNETWGGVSQRDYVAPYSWAGDSNLGESNQHGVQWNGNMHVATIRSHLTH